VNELLQTVQANGRSPFDWKLKFKNLLREQSSASHFIQTGLNTTVEGKWLSTAEQG